MLLVLTVRWFVMVQCHVQVSTCGVHHVSSEGTASIIAGTRSFESGDIDGVGAGARFRTLCGITVRGPIPSVGPRSQCKHTIRLYRGSLPWRQFLAERFSHE